MGRVKGISSKVIQISEKIDNDFSEKIAILKQRVVMVGIVLILVVMVILLVVLVLVLLWLIIMDYSYNSVITLYY